MENAPKDNDFDIGDDKDTDKPKRRASNGSDHAIAVPREGQRVEPFRSGQGMDQEGTSLWRRLISSESQTSESPKTAARPRPQEGQVESAQERDQTVEDLPLTDLSPAEETLVIRRLVEAGSLVDPEAPAADEQPEVTEALDRFHEDILTGNKTLPEAFDGTLTWLEAEHEMPGGELRAEPAMPQLSESVPAEAPSWPGSPGGPRPPIDRSNLDMPSAWSAGYAAAQAEHLPAAVPNTEAAAGYDKSDVVGAALVGGLVGYLVGRRRGRIKTEKRLLPVQKKLEKQVKGLQQDIKKKESVIREKAEEFARERRLATPVRGPAERARERELLRAAASNPAAETKAAPSRERARRGHAENEILRPEEKRIGQMVVTAVEALPLAAIHLAEAGRSAIATTEGPRVSAKERLQLVDAEWASKPASKAKVSTEQAPLIPIDKHVETLSQKDLLELSSKIIVDGTTLKQAFESHQVGEQALRRMVSEHLRGGDVRESLRKEVVEHEIDFERDPRLRDRGRQEPKRSSSSGGAQGLQGLIQRADSSIGGDDSVERHAVLEAHAARQAKRQAREDRRRTQSHLVDAAMLGVIASLIVLIILLIISHS